MNQDHAPPLQTTAGSAPAAWAAAVDGMLMIAAELLAAVNGLAGRVSRGGGPAVP